MENTFTSIVIPLYNKEKYVKRSVVSALKQTCKCFEIIVVDDGSEDSGAAEVEKLARSFPDRIVLISQKNAGVSAARNRGIQESNGELIAFLDADDEWNPEFLEVIEELHHRFPQAGMYATAYAIRNSDGTQRNPIFHRIPMDVDYALIPDYFESVTFGSPPICSSAVVIPRATFEKIGTFREGEPNGEDMDMWGRIALEMPVAFSQRLGAVYHQEAGNRASARYQLNHELPFVTFGKAVLRNQITVSKISPYLGEYLARIQIESVKQNIAAGNRESALQSLADCETRLFQWEKRALRLLAHLPAEFIGYASWLKQQFRHFRALKGR